MRILAGCALVLAACGGSVVPLDGDGGVGDGGAVSDAGLDYSSAGLVAFVRSGGYKSWKAEPAIHASTGPHGGNVRTYVNDLLYASLKAGNTTHPPGSATVKELYGGGTTMITGHAIDAKDSSGKWFFLEGFAPSYASPYYYVGTTNFCASCHATGPDFYAGLLSNLP